MDLATILTIAAQFMQVAVTLAQDGRQQATAEEVAQLRAITQQDIAQIETDVGQGATPSPPS